MELVTVRAVAIGLMDKAELDREASTTEPEAPGNRALYLGAEWHNVPVHRRENFSSNSFKLEGPALVSEDYTVLYIAPGWEISGVAGGLKRGQVLVKLES